MAIDMRVQRTRRALLAGGLGGLAAVVASALARPEPVRAGDDGDVVLGATNSATTSTIIQNLANENKVFDCYSNHGDAIQAWSNGAGKSAVYANSQIASGYGVTGRNTTSETRGYLGGGTFGVRGTSTAGTGVSGVSTTGDGITGSSGGQYKSGVYGSSSVMDGFGVFGRNTASGATGAFGAGIVGVRGSSPAASGVVGTSGGANPPVSGETGVHGYAIQSATAIGAHGQSTIGRGIYGEATSGIGVYATATSGYAIRSVGRVRFEKCIGTATVPLGMKSVLVNPGLDLTATSVVTATLMGSAGGTTTVHRVAVNATANTFTIYLTANSTTNVKVGWHVFG